MEPPRQRLLEICCDNLMSCEIAEQWGADRIELCQALDLGGITPSIGLVKMAKRRILIPIFVMIRPRSGNFTYSEDEVQQMLEDMRACLELGVDGFVTGALNKQDLIDVRVCARLIEAANGLPVTFHRAFDVCRDDNALSKIIDLGFKRLLTSGKAEMVDKGKEKIRKLIREADGKIIIMPGCGINDTNLSFVVRDTNATEYHSSGQRHRDAPERQEHPIVKGTSHYPLPSSENILCMKDTLKSFCKCNTT